MLFGCNIVQIDKILTLGQKQHISRLQLTETNILNRDIFCTICGQLLFIAYSSRPNISYSIAQLCQVLHKQISVKDCLSIIAIRTHLEDTKDLQLRYRPLDQASTELYVVTDSSYNSNRDKTSQFGIIICSVDEYNSCHSLHWETIKCQRITRSMLAEEGYSFSLGYDYGNSLKILLQQCL